MSDIVPYYNPLPLTRAARENKVIAKQNQRRMDAAKADAEEFGYRSRETVYITREWMGDLSNLDYYMSATCGDRPGFLMEMRSLIPLLNVAYSLKAATFLQGRGS